MYRKVVLDSGLYPASVTPLTPEGALDPESLARLLAGYEAAGCAGVVLAGTNGEGPSLSAPEKRDLLALAAKVRGRLALILGIATPSLDEVLWLARQAARHEATAVLVMPPMYFRSAPPEGIRDWFWHLLEGSPVPVLAYHHPAMTGVPITAELLAHLATHPRMAGVKDSSGHPDNLAAFRAALAEEHRLFVGDETLLLSALRAGWSGSISGAANLLAPHLATVIRHHLDGKVDSAAERFLILEGLLRRVREFPQPATHKTLLAQWGRIAHPSVRLPLREGDPAAAQALRTEIERVLGPLP